MSVWDIVDDAASGVAGTAEDIGSEFGSWASTVTGQNFLRGIGAAAAIVGGPLIGAFSVVLPGLARGETLSQAFVSETAYRLRTAADLALDYIGRMSEEERNKVFREIGLTSQQIFDALAKAGIDIRNPTIEQIERALDVSFRDPVRKVLEDVPLVTTLRELSEYARDRAESPDAILETRGLTPEQLSIRLGGNAREDAAASAINAAIGVPLYSADWFEPLTGKFITDITTLHNLRALARHRLESNERLDVLDRRIKVQQDRIDIEAAGGGKDIRDMTTGELYALLQEAIRLNQAQPIIDAIQSMYDARLADDLAVQRRLQVPFRSRRERITSAQGGGGLTDFVLNPGGTGTTGNAISLVSAAVAGYHGYARNKSRRRGAGEYDGIAWGLIWAAFGAAAPIFAIPAAIYQGYGRSASRTKRIRRKTR